jgi:hypothetical protein
MKSGRWLILLGSILLFLGGIAHMIGYRFFVPALIQAGLSGHLLAAVEAVWIAYSIQFWVISLAIAWLTGMPNSRGMLLLLSIIPLIDGVLMYHYVGLFLGTYLVGGGALLVLIGIAMMKPDASGTR